jgi:hypothetical protein
MLVPSDDSSLGSLADFNIDAVPTIQPATLWHLAAGF